MPFTVAHKQTAQKYAARYPHLATLVERAEYDAAAANALCTQIGLLAVPATVTGLELWELCSACKPVSPSDA